MSPAGADEIERLLAGRAPRCGLSAPEFESGAHVAEALRCFAQAASEANADGATTPLVLWRRENKKLWNSQDTR